MSEQAPKKGLAGKLASPPEPKTEVQASAPAPEKPAAPLPRWRVKHPALGAFVVTAATADAAKEAVLRERHPTESQDPAWLAGMKQLSMRVARLPD